MSWFVTPETHRLNLADGEWVDIKVELGLAEQKRLESSPMTGIRHAAALAGGELNADDAEMGLDWGRFYLTKLEVYIVNWSLRDAKGQPVKVTPPAIQALRPEKAEEIMGALNAYLDSRDKARAEDPTTAIDSATKSA
jgi:hypothetical protein